MDMEDKWGETHLERISNTNLPCMTILSRESVDILDELVALIVKEQNVAYGRSEELGVLLRSH